jgi:hypothetical protein
MGTGAVGTGTGSRAAAGTGAVGGAPDAPGSAPGSSDASNGSGELWSLVSVTSSTVPTPPGYRE